MRRWALSFGARKGTSGVPTGSWRGTGPFEAETESGSAPGWGSRASVVSLPAHGGQLNEGISQRKPEK